MPIKHPTLCNSLENFSLGVITSNILPKRSAKGDTSREEDALAISGILKRVGTVRSMTSSGAQPKQEQIKKVGSSRSVGIWVGKWMRSDLSTRRASRYQWA